MNKEGIEKSRSGLPEGSCVYCRDRPHSGTERELRNRFIPVGFHWTRLRGLHKDSAVWIRDPDGGLARYTKRILSKVVVTTSEVKLYWDDNHYLITLDAESVPNRVFIVEDERKLVLLDEELRRRERR